MVDLRRVFSLKVIRTGKLGDPYGKIDGKIIYIKLKKGEKLKTNYPLVRLTYQCSKYGYAELTEQ